MAKKVGIMTCGGDAPGLNGVVRAATIRLINAGFQVLGIEDSMEGLIDLNYRSPYGNRWLSLEMVEGIEAQGGSILGNSNSSHPFRKAYRNADGKKEERDVSDQVAANYKTLGLDCVIVVGGDGTIGIAHQLTQKFPFMRFVACPKTIDNDAESTDQTFGFDTACGTILQSLDRIRDTARSHDRAIIVETMGRDSGFLALHAGMAAAADVILIPEIPYKVESICAKLAARKKAGTPFALIVIAEGAKSAAGGASTEAERKMGEMMKYQGAGQRLLMQLEAAGVSLESRVSVLGYIQRGGSPTAFDRVLSSRFGVEAANYVIAEKYNFMTSLRGTEIIPVPIAEVAGKQKFVDPKGQLVTHARQLGTCFGD